WLILSTLKTGLQAAATVLHKPGIPCSFYDDRVNPTIEKAIHAVAIDEIRAVFDATLMEPHSSRGKEQVTQVWFPGGHGCIGGGCKEECGLSDGALLWMMEEVEKLGLDLDKTLVEDGIEPRYDTPFDNQPKWPFSLGGVKLRKVKDGFSALHESVKRRWNDPSCPDRSENLMEFQEQLDAWSPSPCGF
ncbi:phospholipase effector Tle1 domain-containing protein, partial [Microcoleus sp. D3_18_C4]|uniref:phospholipase effector Tle1 domain-containing protein n=1 Tax=Microcoleus sp. D3_18_C4 TaxID=3055335 RepID=UPI002FD2302F